MTKRSIHQREHDLATARQASPAQDSPVSADPGLAAANSGATVTGVVGDASATEARSGEDVRRRGWFWHWNSIVTQYAPMIGLKGVGLINSYTVWTDRRETSPHRGYAFPSQQREADFYGEDRAELITINKILVALDLIEIRKEMVLRTDEKGRKWKVPHNFYRVKDHGDSFSLTSRDVLTVAELADKDRAVYRYLRRMFSPKFAPIDSQNVWHEILPVVRETAVWQRLATKAEAEESRASARSKAGHVARRTNEVEAVFSVPGHGDSEESLSTVRDSDNDSGTVDMDSGSTVRETSVAPINTGSATTVEPANKGFDEISPSSVDPINSDDPTTVEPTNSTYYQEKTTTTTDQDAIRNEDMVPPDVFSNDGPDDSRAAEITIRHFEEANARSSTPAERRLLGQLAERFDPAARESDRSGWAWVAQAIDDAVSAGSTFVAPRRVREILTRWERDGMPDEDRGAGCDRPARPSRKAVTEDRTASHRPEPAARKPVDPVVEESRFVPPVVALEACGLNSRQLWLAVLADLEVCGTIGRADVATWLRDAAVLGEREGRVLVVGVPHELAQRRASGRYLGAIRTAVERVTGVTYAVEVVLFREWAA